MQLAEDAALWGLAVFTFQFFPSCSKDFLQNAPKALDFVFQFFPSCSLNELLLALWDWGTPLSILSQLQQATCLPARRYW